MLCDTNGGSMPEEIAEITGAVVATQLPVPVGIHCHNDCDLAVANSLAAVDAGAVQVQGTINGFGERCGNADLISVIANLALKKQGYEVLGRRRRRAPDRAVALRLRDGQHELPHAPAVRGQERLRPQGRHARQRASPATRPSYEHIDPELVGNERRVLVSELSGRSNIMALTTQAQHRKPTRELMDRDPGRGGRDGERRATSSRRPTARSTCWSDGAWARFEPHFETLHYHVNVDNKADGEVDRRGDRQDPHRRARSASKWPKGTARSTPWTPPCERPSTAAFPTLDKLHLVDYKVRVINSEAATAAGVRVVIESQDEDDVWGTVGVSENIIEASWIALVDSFEYKLYKDERTTGLA